VAKAPVRRPGERRPLAIPSRVGVSFWHGVHPMMTVVVKATASFAGDGPRRRATWVPARPMSARAAVDGEDMPLPDDFVPCKKRCDVLLVGNVPIHARPSGEVPPRSATVRLGEVAHSFTLASSAPGRVPLRPPYLVASAGGDARVGARPTPDHRDVREHPVDFDWATYQSAHPALRFGFVDAGSTLVVEGLVDEAERLEIELPALAPRALCDWARDDIPADLDMYLDTVVIDLDAQALDLVWRGFVDTLAQPRHDVDRIIVGWGSDSRRAELDEIDEKFGEVLAELPRGEFAYAWEIEDVQGGVEPPPLAPEDFEMARYETLDQTRAPSPTLTLEQHARIAAELVEEREPRAAILERAEMDEFAWALEERALAERMASLPMAEGETVQEEYGRHFLAAQQALARPEDELFRAEDYVRITVGLEVDDPKKVFRDEQLSLGAWMRIDRSWQERIAQSAELSAKLSALFVEERARRGERRAPEVDDEGRIQP
jgi:hypothetical protein